MYGLFLVEFQPKFSNFDPTLCSEVAGSTIFRSPFPRVTLERWGNVPISCSSLGNVASQRVTRGVTSQAAATSGGFGVTSLPDATSIGVGGMSHTGVTSQNMGQSWCKSVMSHISATPFGVGPQDRPSFRIVRLCLISECWSQGCWC